MNGFGFALRTFVAVWLVTALGSSAFAGQSPSTNAIRPPHAGDCSLTIELAPDVGSTPITITLDSPDAPLSFEIAQASPLVAVLRDPLAEGSVVTVVACGKPIATARVAAALPDGPKAASCAAVLPPSPHLSLDDRTNFEASAYMGRAFDNFAARQGVVYINPEAGSTIESEFTAGVDAQYRLAGQQGGRYQFWLATETLHGLRTADVDCNPTPPPPVCSNKATSTDKFFFILEHASTMEAHIDARMEFVTLRHSRLRIW
jgi:hypothetical protein